jgi:tetratricopeptide (TPR) repeat protein
VLKYPDPKPQWHEGCKSSREHELYELLWPPAPWRQKTLDQKFGAAYLKFKLEKVYSPLLDPALHSRYATPKHSRYVTPKWVADMLFSTSAPSPPDSNTLLSSLRKLQRFVLLSLKRLARWSVMPFVWLGHWTVKNPKTAIFLMIPVGVLGVCLSAKLWSWFKPEAQMIISPFELPVGTKGIPWTGKTVANLFIDELQQIITDANEFHGQRFASRHQYQKLPNAPKIPIEKSFELQIQGLSLKQVMNAWDHLRYDQQVFSGDISLGPGNTLILRARVAADKKTMYWEVSKIPGTLDGLKQGLRQLAVQVFTSLNPETVGRYFLAKAMAPGPPNEQFYQSRAAQKVFEEWIQREPTRPEPFFYLSYTYRMLNQLDDARGAAKQALENDNTYYLAEGEIANVLEQEAVSGRNEDRPKTMTEAAKEHEAALRMSRKWWQFGKYWQFGEWRQFWRKGPPDYWDELCVEYSDIKWFEKAKRACDNAILNDPGFSKPWISLGNLYQKLAQTRASMEDAKKDLAAAEGAYREAIRRQPDNFAGLTGLVQVLMSKSWGEHDAAKRRDEAKKECEQAVAAFPRAAQPLAELANVYEAEGNGRQAEEYYQRATKIDGSNPDWWYALALTERRNNGHEKSKEHLQTASELSRDLATLANTSKAFVEQGSGASATKGFKYMEQALKLQPALADNQQFQVYRGDAYLGAQRFGEALDAYTAAAKINVEQQKGNAAVRRLRDDHSFQRHLGDTFFGLKDFERAAACYRKAKAAYSGDLTFEFRLSAALAEADSTNAVDCTIQPNE